MTSTDTTETATVKVTITLFGETREVEAEPMISRNPEREGLAWRACIPGFVATIGRGSARYPDVLILDRYREGIDHPRPGTTKVTDTEGRVWTCHLRTCVRNRQARITGWVDAAGVTNDWDQTRRGGGR